MTTEAPGRRRWRGRALTAIAALHCTFVILLGATAHHDERLRAFVGDSSAWLRLRPGIGSALPPEPWLLSLCWSALFGVTLALLGTVVDICERRSVPIARAISVTLLLLALAGGVLMPASGFWLVAIVAASLVKRP